MTITKNMIGTDSNPVLEKMTRSNSGKRQHPPIRSEPLAKVMLPFVILYWGDSVHC